MPVLLRAAVWNVMTEVRDEKMSARSLQSMTNMLSWQDKLTMLRAAVELANQSIPTPTGLPGGTYSLRVFIAPEYFFAESCERHVVDYETRGHVVAGVTQLSADYPDILLIPGTVSYFKPLVDKQLERERSALDGAHVARSVKYQGLVTPGKEKSTYLAHNTAYAFYNGQQVFKYRKRLDCGELNSRDNKAGKIMVFATGDRLGTFDFDKIGTNLRIGMEICADHDNGVLSKGGVSNLDLQIILAASTGMRTNFAVVRDGGVVLFCTANGTLPSGALRAWQNSAGVMQDLRTAVAAPPPAAVRMDPAARPELAALGRQTTKLQTAYEKQQRKDSQGTMKRATAETTADANKRITNYAQTRGGNIHFYETTIP